MILSPAARGAGWCFVGAVSWLGAAPTPLSAAPLALAPSLATPAQDDHESLRKLLKERRYDVALERADELLTSNPEDPVALGLRGEALLGLKRLDEAAFAFEQALDWSRASGQEKTRHVRNLEKAIKKADRLAGRRIAFFNRAAKKLSESGRELLGEGDLARGAAYLEQVAEVLWGEERRAALAEAAEARAAEEEVDLEAATSGKQGLAVHTHESLRYVVKGELEPELVELVAETMDDIFESYRQIYLGGAEPPAGFKKATIRIYPTWDEMAKHYFGDTPPSPGLGGWWSPGENTVVCYDTREGARGLDEMLGTLFHEASHQFMTFLVREHGGWSPAWLNEGTATFFEGSRAMKDGSVLWPQAAVQRLGSLTMMLPGDKPGVKKVLGFTGAGSYPAEYYAWGWGLVYFLMEYEDPATRTFPYRPLYAEYLEAITSQGQDPVALFEKTFLGERSPQDHADLADFDRDWRRWIDSRVRPLYLGDAREARRLEAIDDALRAADAARAGRLEQSEEVLLERALGHVRFLREEVLRAPRGELALREVEILARLGLDEEEAAAIERVLDLDYRGIHELSDGDRESHVRRLRVLDKKSAAAHTARARAKNLRRDALAILDDYEAQEEEGQARLLCAYTFAARAAALLDDREVLPARADLLRVRAEEAGLMRGAKRSLYAPARSWVSIFSATDEATFRVNPLEIRVGGVGGKHAGRICQDLPLTGDYTISGTLIRGGSLEFGAFHGIVFSATAEEWLTVGLDHAGELELRSTTAPPGRAVTHDVLDGVDLEPPLAEGETPLFTVRAFAEGRLEVTVGEREAIEFELDYELPEVGYPGVFVQGGEVTLREATLEVFL